MAKRQAMENRGMAILITGVALAVAVVVGIVSGGSHSPKTPTTLSAAEVRWVHHFRLGNWSACVPDLNFAKIHYGVASSPDSIGSYEAILNNACSNLPTDDPQGLMGGDVIGLNFAFTTWDLDLQDANGGVAMYKSVYRSEYRNLLYQESVVARDLRRY